MAYCPKTPIPEIMCTLTPAQISNRETLVGEMYGAGMHSIRINTAHMRDTDQLGALCSRLKSMLPEVRILIDTKGPEMRTTAIADDGCIDLTPGMDISLRGVDDDSQTTTETICVNYPGIHNEVNPGDRLLIDDGKIVLQAVDTCAGIIRAQVITGGIFGSRKGITVFGKDIDLPAVSPRDREYITYAANSPFIDEIAHSFVRSASDVMAVRNILGQVGKPIIAKIENHQGVENLESILRVSDAVLIARGDLTASLGADAVPPVQESIAHAAKKSGKRLYLATNILSSMMTDAYPSSADIAGISTAMRQGVDVMLLTNETAAGKHPLESVKELRHLMETFLAIM